MKKKIAVVGFLLSIASIIGASAAEAQTRVYRIGVLGFSTRGFDTDDHQCPLKGNPTWQATIAAQRTELETIFEQSPSLKRELAGAIGRAYPNAVRSAAIETGRPKEDFPPECPIPAERIISAIAGNG